MIVQPALTSGTYRSVLHSLDIFFIVILYFAWTFRIEPLFSVLHVTVALLDSLLFGNVSYISAMTYSVA